MWRLIYAPISWLLYIILIELPLIIVGVFVVGFAAARCAYYQDTITGYYHWSWSWMKLWDNEDDGIANNDYSGLTNMWERIEVWDAIRNPVDNLKQVPYICCAIDSTKVHFVGTFGDVTNLSEWRNVNKSQILKYDTKVPQWFFAWQGFYSTFYWQFYMPFGGLWLFWIGWKIKPNDVYGVEQYRKPRAPAGVQFNKQG